jgi:hypothetical protein
VCVHAGVVFAATSTAHKHKQHSAAASTTRSDTSLPGLAPFLAPATPGQLDAQLEGPPQQTAVPLSYHVWLNLSDPALYRPGDATGRVAAGFGGRVNITMHVEQVCVEWVHGSSLWPTPHQQKSPSCQPSSNVDWSSIGCGCCACLLTLPATLSQDASCLSLHARNLSFSSIAVRLLGTDWKQQQQQPGPDVCLCGPAPTCLTTECGRLFKARPGQLPSCAPHT